MQKTILKLLLVYVLMVLANAVQAQADTAHAPGKLTRDTIGHKAHVKKGNIFKFAMNAVTRSRADTGIISTKAEAPFLPYAGKIIRHITVKEFGFDQSFTDTTKKSTYFGTRLLNRFHRKSRGWVIRNNIFIRENSVLNPYKVADNERYFRSLEFIQDARILVKPVAGDSNYVDLEVITKDHFSLIAGVSELSTGNFRGNIGDANVLGMGQKVNVVTLLEKGRSPGFGYDLKYTNFNVGGSFVNLGFGITTINQDLQNIRPDEHGWYISAQRPLVSQYKHFAGGLTIGRYQASNNYGLTENEFYNYGYNKFDVWGGYNIAINKYQQNSSIKDRRFVSVRYFKNDFFLQPLQTKGVYNFRYDTREAILGQYTFFKQNFYKTNYIYGFGNTEDVPNGYNIAGTAGYYRQADLKRAYAGIDANVYMASNKSDFIQYFLRTGAFFNRGKLQDAAFLAGTSIFSRLMVVNNVKVREYINFSYTHLINRVGLDPLNINNVFGLRNFNADSVMGTQRLSLYAETFMFLKYKVFGFKFAPFVLGDASLLTPENRSLFKSDLYCGVGGGVRTRNENLVFNTIQLRFVYFPRTPGNTNAFKLTLTTNLNFRYNSNYVTAPEIIQLNTDNNNGIY